MRSSLSFSLLLAAASLLLASCGPQGGDAELLASAARSEPKACSQAPVLTLGAATLTVTGATSKTQGKPHPCGAGPADHYTFRIDRPSMFYADTFGSTIDANVGLVADDCAATLACGGQSCGPAQGQLARWLEPGTYHVLVAGRGDREHGPYVLHLQAVAVPGPPAGEIPRGDAEVSGTFSSFGGDKIPCGGVLGRGFFTWWWYGSCPSDSGLFSARTIPEGTGFDAALSWVDVDDGQEVCDLGVFDDTFPASIEAVDEAEGGLHLLKIGVVRTMSAPPDSPPYRLATRRP
jgi:hypothetical protein